jgi:hypothetical protein
MSTRDPAVATEAPCATFAVLESKKSSPQPPPLVVAHYDKYPSLEYDRADSDASTIRPRVKYKRAAIG